MRRRNLLLMNYEGLFNSRKLKHCTRSELLVHLAEAQESLSGAKRQVESSQRSFQQSREFRRDNMIDRWYEIEVNRNRGHYEADYAYYQHLSTRIKYIERRLEYVRF